VIFVIKFELFLQSGPCVHNTILHVHLKKSEQQNVFANDLLHIFWGVIFQFLIRDCLKTRISRLRVAINIYYNLIICDILRTFEPFIECVTKVLFFRK